MQLLISVEPDTRRVPNLSPRAALFALLPVFPVPLARPFKRPTANSTSCRRASCRLVPESYPLPLSRRRVAVGN